MVSLKDGMTKVVFVYLKKTLFEHLYLKKELISKKGCKLLKELKN